MIINAREKYNLELVGNENFEFEDAVINCANKNYTFAWLVFKRPSCCNMASCIAKSALVYC